MDIRVSMKRGLFCSVLMCAGLGCFSYFRSLHLFYEVLQFGSVIITSWCSSRSSADSNSPGARNQGVQGTCLRLSLSEPTQADELIHVPPSCRG